MARDKRQETRDKRQEARDKRQETRDKRPETRDQRQETRDKRRDRRPETIEPEMGVFFADPGVGFHRPQNRVESMGRSAHRYRDRALVASRSCHTEGVGPVA